MISRLISVSVHLQYPLPNSGSICSYLNSLIWNWGCQICNWLECNCMIYELRSMPKLQIEGWAQLTIVEVPCSLLVNLLIILNREARFGMFDCLSCSQIKFTAVENNFIRIHLFPKIKGCLCIFIAVEWICWLNGQRKRAPTLEVV